MNMTQLKDESKLTQVYLKPKLVRIAIDYLRVTRPISSTTKWPQVANVIFNNEMQGGVLKAKPASMATMRGKRVGRAAYMQSDTHEMIQLSSALADDWWYTFARQFGINCTRVDFTVDIVLDKDDPHVARKLMPPAEKYWREKLEKRGYRPPVLYKSIGGDTLYFGSRESERYIRIYDKKRESGGVENTWRFEAELKSSLAQVALQTLAAHPAEWPSVVEYEVKRGLERWGLVFVDLKDGVPMLDREKRVKTEVQAKLEWLSSAVAPTIKKLFDAGYASETIAALGLEESG